MFAAIARAIFGNANDRSLKAYQRRVPEINALEPAMQALSDEALAAKTAGFRARLAAGAKLDELLPEAFAVVREGSRRALGMRHFDVQLIGGMVLHDGKIAEMKTGEGKTLVATLPVYLNALTGGGVHVVTVNDYLAARDAEWMGTLYTFLGLTVGVIVHGIGEDQRRAAYGADITYGTNNEFGFDYLRDNMKYRLEDMVQRDFSYAIVDEVDSILIDEARTPLIISGPAEDSSDLYRSVNAVMAEFVKDASQYEKDEKFRTANMTEAGSEALEEMLRQAGIISEGNLYDTFNVSVLHHAQQSLRAHVLFTRDVDYIVRQDKVVIIDEFTGRMMEGRRDSEGLHQALEKAQKKVEARNFDTRKNVLRYDDVMNNQRKEVYAQRREFMRAEDVIETVTDMRAEVIAGMVALRIPERAYAEQWQSAELAEDVQRVFGLDLPVVEWAREEGIDEGGIRERIERAANELMAAKAANFGPETMRFVEKSLLLQLLDRVWKEHLLALDHLRQGIGLRAYGQRDPLNEYKSEAFTLFNAMLDELKEQVTSFLSRVDLTPQEPEPPVYQTYQESHPSPDAPMDGYESGVENMPTRITAGPLRATAVDPDDPSTWGGTARNAACPCGSGKKFKHCHGVL